MPKKIPITLLCTLVFTIVALFSATKAMAQCDYPECFVVNGWKVEIYKGTSENPSPFPWIISEDTYDPNTGD